MNNDQLSSTCFIFLGLMVLIAAYSLDIGAISAPGSGFIPFLSGAGMCLFGGVGFIEAIQRSRRGERWSLNLKNINWQSSLMTFAGLVIYAFSLKLLGFLISTTLLMMFLLRYIIPQPWRIVLLGAMVISVGSFLIFKIFLHVQLPSGFLGF